MLALVWSSGLVEGVKKVPVSALAPTGWTQGEGWLMEEAQSVALAGGHRHRFQELSVLLEFGQLLEARPSVEMELPLEPALTPEFGPPLKLKLLPELGLLPGLQLPLELGLIPGLELSLKLALTPELGPPLKLVLPLKLVALLEMAMSR